MTEKDSLGDKLRDKEKADEDSYFAARDRELIAKLKARGTTQPEATQQESTAVRCPKCSEPLGADTLDGVRVDVCRACQGMWLDRSELEKAVQHETSGWLRRCLEHVRGR